jgi:hypothetical protein
LSLNSRISKRIAIAVCAVALVAVGFFAVRAVTERVAENRRRMAFDNLTANAVNRIAELAVLEYRYADVMELNRKFAVGGVSTSLVRFSGVVKAGIADASGITASYNPAANRVTVTLPPAVIIDNTVDIGTVKIWDLKRNIFVPISTELKIQEVTAFKDRIARELSTSGFLAEADERASVLVSSFYAAFGAEIEVRTRN